jgi:alkylation response protein AidB-like acyl-CoA dehydrogenase
VAEAINQRLTIEFSEEQSMLLDTAVSFFSDKSPTSAVRAQLETEFGFERSVWNEMVDLGWSSLAIPAEFGGSGLSLAEAVTIAEPMGRHLFSAPLTSTQLFVQGVLAAGNAAQKADYLGRVCEGAIGTVALFERDGNWDLSTVVCEAVMAGDSLRLSGVKSLVTDAGVADFILASVRYQNAPALVVLTASEVPAAARRRESVIDETRRSFSLTLEGITVPANRLIPAAAPAFTAIRNAALLLLSAEAAGGTAGVLDLVVDYLNTRTAFGRKIGSFQALKHTCADILVGLERSRSHVYHAATIVAAGGDAEAALRMAKTEACDTFAFAGDRAIQFHGGFGFTYECDAQLYLRRSLWLQYWFGDGAHHRKRLADLLLGHE